MDVSLPVAARVRELVREHGSPLWVYLPEEARRAARRMQEGAARWGEARVAYSVKTNPLGALLRDVRAAGCLAEVVSRHELECARAAGFGMEEIVFNGPLKSRADLEAACKEPPLVLNADDPWEVEALAEMAGKTGAVVPIGVRLCARRPDGSSSRFGMDAEDAAAALRRIRGTRALHLRCVHHHLGTQVSEDAFLAAVRDLRAWWDAEGLDRDVLLDLGGGFPYRHDFPPDAQPFDPAAFFARLAEAWGPGPRPPLLVEPGRWIAAPSFVLATRVLSVKRRGAEPPLVVVDAGINQNVGALFHAHLWEGEGGGVPVAHRLAGPACMEEDLLGERVAPVPARGEVVLQRNAGAYSLVLSRTFIQPRPPIVILPREGEARLLEPREEFSASYGVRG